MTLYSLALFMHVVGALGLFVALGLEWTSLLFLRRAVSAEEVRLWSNALALVRRLGPASMVAILLPALYMTATTWGWVPWIVVALASMLLFPVLGALSGMRLARVGQAAAAERGSLSTALRDQLRHPLFLTSIRMRTALALGIVFLMTVKPGLAGAVIAISVAVVLGLASALPAWNRARVQSMDTAA
ncbi:MAG: hypothetical protein M1546_03265 [Chloroflexi bacterium]|nr:hypothetical protein [Chloroflexota bacterium]